MEELLARYAKVSVRKRIGIFAGLVAGLLLVHWFLIYSAQASELAALEAKYTKLETERAEKQAYIENLQKYEARLHELQENLNTARSQLPDETDEAQLFAQLGNKAKQAGLEIARFEPKGESPQDFYAEIQFDMKVHGSYHEIGTFVDALGKLDRILNVTGIAIASPRTVNQKVVVDAGFTIKTYRFVEGAQAQAAPAAKKGKNR